MGMLFYCISIFFIASRVFIIILLTEFRDVPNCVLNYKNFKLVNTSVPDSGFIQIKSDTESTPEFQGKYIIYWFFTSFSSEETLFWLISNKNEHLALL